MSVGDKLGALLMRKQQFKKMAALAKLKQKRMEKMKIMAKYGDVKDFTYTDPKGNETKFKLNHVGLMGSDTMGDEIRDENGQVSLVEMRKQFFEHVIRTEDGAKVNYAYFEEQDFGSQMLKEVTKAAQDYIFPKS